jgi:hypothetical protein
MQVIIEDGCLVEPCSLVEVYQRFASIITEMSKPRARNLFETLIAPMMEAASTSETLVNFCQTTMRYNPEDSHLHTRRRENLKSYLIIFSNMNSK